MAAATSAILARVGAAVAAASRSWSTRRAGTGAGAMQQTGERHLSLDCIVTFRCCGGNWSNASAQTDAGPAASTIRQVMVAILFMTLVVSRPWKTCSDVRQRNFLHVYGTFF